MPSATNEDIIKLCNELNLTYVDRSNFPTICNNKKYNQTYVKFICNAHQKYGVQEKQLYDLQRLKKPCQYCNHSKLNITFKDEMNEINPNIEILSEYVNWNTKIKCKCKIDGTEWDGTVSCLLNGYGCKICGHRKRWDSRGRKTTDDFVKEMENINPNIEIIGEYNGSHKLIKCKCKIDGREWESYACNLLNKSAGCPQCMRRNMGSKITNGEKKMYDILEDLGYHVQAQYIFSDCVYIRPLKFDGYDVAYNIAFEYQGEQHYFPIDFAGKGEEYAKKIFNIYQIRDEIKRNYCRNNGIKLIEIPYWEYDNMELYLKEQLKLTN